MPTSKASTSSPRGERIVYEDPHHLATDADRAKARAWFDDALAGVKERYSGPPVIIMARLHEADTHGTVLVSGEYDYLTLPPEKG